MGKLIFCIPQMTALFFIKCYQKTLSGDHGILGKFFYPKGMCKFHPTCSEYSYQAIKKYGMMKGGGKAIKRLSKCHPFSMGGEDPLT